MIECRSSARHFCITFFAIEKSNEGFNEDEIEKENEI